jgi:hypothetical protein
MNMELRNAFRYWRGPSRQPQRRDASKRTALAALALARVDLAAGTKRYGAMTGFAVNPRDGNGIAWVENVSGGFRFVDYADKLAGCIQHTGWYTNEFYDSSYRGVVYQLPGRNRKPQFVAGYADPDNEGCARIDFSALHNDSRDAALAADRFAEIEADKERDYQTAWQAGLRYVDSNSELNATRHEFIALRSEMRDARKALSGKGIDFDSTSICLALTSQLKELARKRSELIADRAKLLSEFGKEAGFRDA